MKLNKGEVICDKCNGVGLIDNSAHTVRCCIKCYGSGKLDWAENITGKKDKSLVWVKDL